MLLIFCVGNVSAINPDNNTIGFDNIEPNNSDVENSSLLDSSEKSDRCNISNKSYSKPYEVNKDFVDLVDKTFKNKTTYDVSMELYNQSKERYVSYDVSRLQKLSLEILTTLNNIDNEINTSLSLDVSDLTKKINTLKIQNIKNPIKAINNSLNSNGKCLRVVNGYSKTFENYLTKINEYVELKNTLKDNSEINTLNIDDSIIKSIHSKIILLDSLKQRFDLINKDLKIIENIFKTKKLYDTIT